MPEPLREEELAHLRERSLKEKQVWLAAHEVMPSLSEEARRFLRDADLIVYGPGTQHSSLLPSYRIAAPALRRARGMKVFVTNLGSDHDIQGLSAKDLSITPCTMQVTTTMRITPSPISCCSMVRSMPDVRTMLEQTTAALQRRLYYRRFILPRAFSACS